MTIPALFQDIVAKKGGDIAVNFGAEGISYNELDNRSRQLAKCILKAGIPPDSPIGLQSRRSVEMIIALLGILRAGCHFVFLDPKYPVLRRRKMMECCGCSHVILDEADPALDCIPHLLRDIIKTSLAGRGPEVPVVLPSQRAYIMFTSGSENAPKVVAGTHHALASRLAAMWSEIPFAKGESCIFRKSLGFIGSMTELFEPLLKGVPIELLSDAEVNDPYSIFASLTRKRVTRFWCFPPLMRAILLACRADSRSAPHLKYCFSSGDFLDEKIVEEFNEVFPGARLINIYGSTEVTSDVSFGEVVKGGDIRCIGLPMCGCRMYVLDAALEPLPIGITGDLYVGGDFVCNGYHGEGLNSDRFPADRFSKVPGLKLFKTGDRAFIDNRGVFTLVGRQASEVKIRGFRVSLGEVEGALRALPGVTQAAVALSVSEGEQTLDGFYVGSRSIEEVRTALDATLPNYMVPTYLQRLEQLPLTENGKVDRKSLLANKVQPLGTTHYVPPATKVERTLAEMWKKVLKVERVGLNDNFFHLGGHSLSLVNVMAEIESVFGVRIGVNIALGNPTLESLGRVVSQLAADGAKAGRRNAWPSPANSKRVEPINRPKSSWYASINQKEWWDDIKQPGTLALRNLGQIFVQLEVAGPLDVECLGQAVVCLFRKHPLLGKRFQESAGDLFLVDAEDLTAAFTTEEGIGASGALRPLEIDLRSGPLLRIVLAKLGPGRHLLGIAIHHIVLDGWATEILADDLVACYLKVKKNPSYKAKATDYTWGDYTSDERDVLQGGGYDSSVQFWSGYLRGPIPSPISALASQIDTGIVPGKAVCDFDLDARLFDIVKSVAVDYSHTRFTVILGLVKLVLFSMTGVEDIIVSSTMARRRAREKRNLVGYVSKKHYIRTKLNVENTVPEVLGNVAKSLASVIENQDVPLVILKRDPCIQSALRNMGLEFKIVFQNFPRAQSTIPGLTWKPMAVASDPATHADMALYITESAVGRGYSARMVWRPDMFTREVIERFVGKFTTFVHRLPTANGSPIGQWCK